MEHSVLWASQCAINCKYQKQFKTKGDAAYLGRRKGAKNDYNDALHLANELRCNHVVPVYHDDSELMRMRNLTSAYQSIAKDIAKAKTRYTTSNTEEKDYIK